MHLSIFGINLAVFFFSYDLENKVKVPKPLSPFYHVHVLDSCKFGQNQLIQSEENVHFTLNLAFFFLCDLENSLTFHANQISMCLDPHLN